MAQIMIELSDDLAARAAEMGIDIDYAAEEAVRQRLESLDFAEWLRSMDTADPIDA